ncbi:hypothetical protein [Paludisphaera borealis]|uniref:Retaining beta-glycosidase n=1 Tax=Paludisphaera borealis TaxID=1387353 RepID=A0A1U7CJ57_9BACT|nr:hypothetical protein [Paludisphaera borealis]APW58937.1 retaining beta-glycosidase [Paludisphaera borealis]
MRIAFALALFAALGSTSAPAQLALQIDARGTLAEVRVGDAIYLSDVAVTLVKPGWTGNLADQRAVDPATVRVHKAGRTTTYTMPLRGENLTAQLIERVTRDGDLVDVQYEVIPDQDVELETVLLQGSLATASHAGKTSYLVGGPTTSRGILPAELNDKNHILWSGDPEWLGFGLPGVGGLRVVPRDMGLQLQDDRKWNTPAFGLLATAGGGEHLARKPIRFALSLRAEAAGRLDDEVKQGALAGVSLVDDRPLALKNARIDRDRLEAFASITVDAEIEARYDNPFDPDQIAVDGEVATPAGKIVNVPGYFQTPFQLEAGRGGESLKVAGASGFRVRYTPTVAGPHQITIKVKDRSGEVRAKPLAFIVDASKTPGFVRVAAKSPRYFAFDDGASYFAIGENVCWGGGKAPMADYAAWFAGLGKAGGNWARLWLAFNEKGLEWMPAPTPKGGTGSYQGLGRYALDNAWRLDEVVHLAERNGVRLMFCIGTYGEFKDGGFFNEGSWVSNPYNAKNGGPCASPDDFWTNAEARKLYKQRLRYIIARWGCSPQVFAWEFWNEVQPTPAVEAWTAEMAAYLKQHDPNRHLVSTSYGSPAIWKDRNIDLSMTHMYGTAGATADFTAQIQRETHANLAFGKPYLLAEFGIDWQAGDEKWDPKGNGLNMHNGAWAALASGSAGTAMLWWWDGYVHPKNVYHVLTPVQAFAATIDWANTPFRPIERIEIVGDPSRTETFRDVTLAGSQSWGKTASNRYTALHDGTVKEGPVAVTLGSPKRGNANEVFSEVVWTLDMPQAGKVLVHLGEVCSGGRLRVALDGHEVLDRPLATGEPGKGPWKKSRLLEPWKVWVSDYDEAIPIDVPAGRHELTLANADGDWLQIRKLTLPSYRSSRHPEVDALGLAAVGRMILWVHNRQSTWRADFDGKSPEPQEKLTLHVPTTSQADWRVEWWDTFQGVVVQTDQVQPASGILRLTPPRFDRDLAARLTQKP